MKYIITILAFVLITPSVLAQTPEKMSYQAVVRDGSNTLVTSAAVGMQISILQGAADGAAVYVETQTPTTNANGLLSLEIGDGTIVSGDFTVIDWSNGPYFIQTETDPTGGTSYTITGTSQLMSVPYSLYAKTSGSSTPGPQGPQGNDGNGIASTVDNEDGTFTITYDDGTTFTTSDLTGPTGPQGPTGNEGNGITSTVDNGDGTYTFTYDDGSTFTTSDLTGAAGPQGPIGNDGNGITSTVDNEDGTFTFTFDDGTTFTTPDLTGATGATGPQGPIGNDGNGIVSTVDNEDGTFTITFDDETTFTTSDLTGPQGPAGSQTTYAVGDFAQGGVVIWVDETNQHGLVAAITDAIPGTTRWYAGTYGFTRSTGDGVYGGEGNTNLIMSAHMVLGDDGGNYAASVCRDLVVNQGGVNYGDWYLPTVEELHLLGQNYQAVNTTSIANGGTALVTSPYWSSVELNDIDAIYVLITPGGVSDSFVNKAATFNVRAVRRF